MSLSSGSLFSKIMVTAPPTTDALSERQLAAALGYPLSWHVVRLSHDKPDFIYAGNPSKNVAVWFNHEAALRVAAEWEEGKSSPYKGGHLLPKKPLFKKNEVVEVLYKKKWYPAAIVKRKDYEDEYRYTVLYSQDGTTQEEIKERKIRLAPPDAAAFHLATTLGFPDGWRAVYGAKNRIQFFSPDSTHFKSQKAALDHLAALEEADDPPWRTEGHELVGRRVEYVIEHRLSGKRKVEIRQPGTVAGWISEEDTDRKGEPGYVSEDTGKPTNLFHVVFDDDPGKPYAKEMIDFQDMEEAEVRSMLVEEETAEPPSKRVKQDEAKDSRMAEPNNLSTSATSP